MPDQPDIDRERFASAAEQIRVHHLAARERAYAELRARQQLQVIDELIAVLEERNLEGQRRVDRAVRRRLRDVEAALGLAFPRRVVRARNTARMHGALMDWMEAARGRSMSPGRHSVEDGELVYTPSAGTAWAAGSSLGRAPR